MDDDAIVQAIRAHPEAAAATMLAIQPAEGSLTADAIRLVARFEHRDAAEVWLEQLQECGLVLPFVAGLRAHGVVFDGDPLAEDADGGIPPELLRRFLSQAQSFRCRILKNGVFAGSGVLVGPSLVLTAWHVIAVAAPGQSQRPPPELRVQLSDQSTCAARVPAVYQSECGMREYSEKRAPRRDAEVAGRHDIALLELERPAAAHLAHVPVPVPAPIPLAGGHLVVVHSPAGNDAVQYGHARRIRNLSTRWRHNVHSKAGSSGGACFDRDLALVGVHQAAYDGGARFVPAACFTDDIADKIRRDVAPPALWSLDGTAEGSLVIGRQEFCEAVAVAGDGGRVHGVRIKWSGLSAPTGLSYSHDVLAQLLVRRGADHHLVRIPQNEIVGDFTTVMRETVARSGLELLTPADDRTRAADSDAPPEATARHRAELLAADIEAAAEAAGITVWLFIDRPSVMVTESRRLVLESFVRGAMASPHVRLVLAGMNDFAFAGEEFTRSPMPGRDSAPGLLVEYLRGFQRGDVLDFLVRASRALTGDSDLGILQHEADRALYGHPHVNGFYDPSLLPMVAESVRPVLKLLAGRPQ